MWTRLGLLLLLLIVRLWVFHAGSTSTEWEAKPAAPKESVELSRSSEPQQKRWTHLRYLACCPRCGERLVRRDYFTWQIQIRRKCRKCRVALRSNLKLDAIWSLITATPFAVCFYLALAHGTVSWFVVLAALLLHFTAGYVLFPFNTRLEMADEVPNPGSRPPTA